MSDQTMIMFAHTIRDELVKRELPNTHDNRTMIMREILDTFVADGTIMSYTWVGDNIKLNLKKH